MKQPVLFMAILLPILFISCTKEDFTPQGPELVVLDTVEVSVSAGGMTIGASVKDLTEVTATFFGEVAKDSLQYTAKSYGVVYTSSEEDSLTVSNSTKIQIKKLDDDNCFESIEGKLTPGASYLWTLFVEVDGEYSLGEVKMFSTAELVAPVVKEVTGITAESATFEGTVTLLQGEAKKVEFGILYSESRSALKKYDGEEFVIEDISKRGKFSATLDRLNENTEYYFMPYVSVNKSVVYGEIGNFTTANAPVPGADVAGIDLSNAAKATANCYIVSESGQYKFPAIKGNGGEYVEGGDYAEVLWETFGTSVTPRVGALIEKVEFMDNYVSFVVPEEFKKGNASVAVRNSEGTILWSWHIWLTDQPAECVLVNDAGILMDRNLGATSAEPGVIESYGLMYQWGRKDPFMGAASVNDGYPVATTGEWPAMDNSAEVGTEYWIENPTVCTEWDIIDPTLWSPSVKKVQDPCPYGWKVPGCSEDGEYFGETAGIVGSVLENGFYGVVVSREHADSEIWFPAAGFSRAYNGEYWIAEQGNHGLYWLSRYDKNQYMIHGNYGEGDGAFGTSSSWTDGATHSIRCIKE